ncbi:MAG: hypothetical protein FD133_1534 [Erysipelotrichaceae bacterium]|nr:MAG: hypothetical protein FD133_1534 [Erysipelotrichaceae bacterium]
MNKITMDVFYTQAMDLIDLLEKQEMENMIKAAELCAEAIKNDGVVHIFGSGHSVGFGSECTGRAGSLVPFHMIETNNHFERRANVADKLYDLYDVRPQDVFIVISNSGINGVVIDLAITAKAKGHKIIIITSMKHTLAEPSRHPSGKKLYELGDVVIDNCGPRGDALIETGELEKICSVSSITGIYIAQSLTAEICRILAEDHCDIPLLLSEEVSGYEKFNADLLNQYKGRIS